MVRLLSLVVVVSLTVGARAQELPYFVTYSHHLEEPGALELEAKLVSGRPQGGNRFVGFPFEIEYGTCAWWTSELYLEGQTTAKDSTVFTGFRIENRFRPLLREHWVNPVLYVEFEDINGANKSLREIVGHDGQDDLAGSNADARAEKKREVEAKLILSSNAKGWNFSENFIAEKNVKHAPWEFGYALATSRPLRLAGSTSTSSFALENFTGGVEMYGGLGDTDSLTMRETSHYVGPTIGWTIPNGVTLMGGVNFGVTEHSLSRIYRVGMSYEIGQLSRLLHPHEGGR